MTGADQALVRPYTRGDRAGVRRIYGDDRYARPALNRRYRGYAEYLADTMSYYTDYEPESALVAAVGDEVVGALLGAVDTERCNRITDERVRPLVRRRCLRGDYGWPGWLLANVITDIASFNVPRPPVDLGRYPAHLHIGVAEAWQRRGVGTRLMERFISDLRERGAPGLHLYASSFNWKGVAFYRKLGLEVLGQFHWRLHDGERLRPVTEIVFGMALGGVQ